MNSCLLDANIVLDFLNRRERYLTCLEIVQNYDRLYITANSYLNIVYLLRKTNRSKKDITEETRFLEILDTTKKLIQEALPIALKPDDIEDCCEILTAKTNKLDFITADENLFENYSKVYKRIVLAK
jgi:predicted nucleic acid-binding protein